MSEEIICPYPGLRPFTEEESIFFKGREEHISQIVTQLEEKKFLMLTGASGDGKSSLVYAGVIPNARAGFFKAKFNNWVIADFRPERSPLRNMAQALSRQLKLGNAAEVEKEFGYGFSALTDIYKGSGYWVDQKSDEFKSLTADAQKKTKRRGANLLILVDQFEEFFTNPENYLHGKSSLESQAVVNLLLETTRLSIEQDLPIYIICTMRSDYIGQCAAFRGLPEYIGYSQFFVPRLKRKEIHQVIEEPALLNGNRISKRLIQMLINEMSDGIDQLPVLQHALNQIWQKADMGRAEMDVIHFAMINGISRDELAGDDRVKFDDWFATLPEFKKKLFAKSSLGDVLDAHANELYETANKGMEDRLSIRDAKLIVKTAFKCLTKIDEGRAVRNRMTVREVTDIINRPHITTREVNDVLLPFRLQGTTFLRPFKFSDADPDTLAEDVVLDITHESLIRNWDKLGYWAKQEYDHLQLWRDFEKQLQRWLQNGKSSGYLLPIGPLTFFEDWYKKVRINKHWLARYDDREIEHIRKLADGKNTIEQTNQFLRRSARKLFVSRMVLRYGADRIIAVFAILLFFFSCTYFYYDFMSKQNNFVLEDVFRTCKDLLTSKYVTAGAKADHLIARERLLKGSTVRLLKELPNDSSRLEVAVRMFANCYRLNLIRKPTSKECPISPDLMREQVRLISKIDPFRNSDLFLARTHQIQSVILSKLVYDRTNNAPIEGYDAFCANYERAFMQLLSDTSKLRQADFEKFHIYLQYLPVIQGYSPKKINLVIDRMNPFVKESARVFNLIYPKDETIAQNWSISLSHKGGYYQLANLFAYTGNIEAVNRCYDSIIKYNKNFVNVDYGYTADRILAAMLIGGKLQTEEGQKFVKRVASDLQTKHDFPYDFMLADIIAERKRFEITYYTFTRIQEHKPWDLQFHWEKITYPALSNYIDYLVGKLPAEYTGDRKNYLEALLYKLKAVVNNQQYNYRPELIESSLYRGFQAFSKVSEDFAAEKVSVGTGAEKTSVLRSDIFRYCAPLYISSSGRVFGRHYFTTLWNKPAFLNYITRTGKFEDIFLKKPDDIRLLNSFLLNYYWSYAQGREVDSLDVRPLTALLAKRGVDDAFDMNALRAFLIVKSGRAGQSGNARTYDSRLNFSALMDRNKLKLEDNHPKYYLLGKSLLLYYWVQQQSDSARARGFELLKAFPDGFEKRNALLVAIDSLQRYRRTKDAIELLDTLVNRHLVNTQKFGNKLFEILGRLSTADADRLALTFIKDKSDKVKPECMNFFVSGKAYVGNYLKARDAIPAYVSSSTQLNLCTSIVKNEAKRRHTGVDDGWSGLDRIMIEGDWSSGVFEMNETNDVWLEGSD
jgi:hypothetical protein